MGKLLDSVNRVEHVAEIFGGIRLHRAFADGDWQLQENRGS